MFGVRVEGMCFDVCNVDWRCYGRDERIRASVPRGLIYGARFHTAKHVLRSLHVVVALLLCPANWYSWQSVGHGMDYVLNFIPLRYIVTLITFTLSVVEDTAHEGSKD